MNKTQFKNSKIFSFSLGSGIFIPTFLIDSKRGKKCFSCSSEFGTLCFKRVVYRRTSQNLLNINVYFLISKLHYSI